MLFGLLHKLQPKKAKKLLFSFNDCQNIIFRHMFFIFLQKFENYFSISREFLFPIWLSLKRSFIVILNYILGYRNDFDVSIAISSLIRKQPSREVLLKQHCVKSVQIRSYFWLVFSCIRIEYVDLLRSEYRKIRTRNNSVFGHFSRTVGVHPITNSSKEDD